MISATELAAQRVKARLELAEEIKADARKPDRLKRHFCKSCFYSSMVGGAAMTNRPCMSCGIDQMYGSTNTDVLCMACASKNSLCKHCGGDLEMRVRRKVWPDDPILMT